MALLRSMFSEARFRKMKNKQSPLNGGEDAGDELVADDGASAADGAKPKGKGKGKRGGRGRPPAAGAAAEGKAKAKRQGSVAGKSQADRHGNCGLFCREFKLVSAKQKGCEDCYRDLEAVRRDAASAGAR